LVAIKKFFALVRVSHSVWRRDTDTSAEIMRGLSALALCTGNQNKPYVRHIYPSAHLPSCIYAPVEAGMSGNYRKVIRNHINLLSTEQKFKSVHVVTDVDPL
jgi:hypothetical protein